MASQTPSNKTRSAAATTDQIIFAGRCILYSMHPELASNTGTVTVADSTTVTGTNDIHVAAIGLLAAGKEFGPRGIRMDFGIVIKQSVTTDRMLIVWEPY